MARRGGRKRSEEPPRPAGHTAKAPPGEELRNRRSGAGPRAAQLAAMARVASAPVTSARPRTDVEADTGWPGRRKAAFGAQLRLVPGIMIFESPPSEIGSPSEADGPGLRTGPPSVTDPDLGTANTVVHGVFGADLNLYFLTFDRRVRSLGS
jgi:hypothetical protein